MIEPKIQREIIISLILHDNIFTYIMVWFYTLSVLLMVLLLNIKEDDKVGANENILEHTFDLVISV